MNCRFRFRLFKAAAVLLVAISTVSVAQYRRVVVEPTIPSVCAVLDAMLLMYGGILNAKEETKFDTTRVQRTLDNCGTGRVLELGSKGTANAFLIGPIAVPPGVTLLVDGGVTVIASRDPRLYDLHPDSCGVVNDQPLGCKAVISDAHADVSCGPGTVNFRMTGNDVTAFGTPYNCELAACNAMYVPFDALL